MSRGRDGLGPKCPVTNETRFCGEIENASHFLFDCPRFYYQ